MKVLVINCGSSSLKYQLIDSQTEEVLAKGLCERIGIDGSKLTHKPTGKEDYVVESPMKDHQIAVKLVLDALTDKDHGVITDIKEISAVGHRVLHAGQVYSDSIVVNEDVKRVIRECFDLGPLHNPANLIGIEACEAAMPGVPQVAVFDTAFGQSMPKKAYLYAIPYEYYEKYGIRRYGFHGTSHSFVSKETIKFANLNPENCKVIVCHLGNGASISASIGGKCVDTSMGLTPLEGLIMGTRSGDVDPAVVQFICNKEGKDVNEVLNILNKKSGVLGMSGGISSDDPDALDKLNDKLENLRRNHEFMKAANAAIRKGKTLEAKLANLMALGVSEGEAQDILKPDFLGRVGFAPYSLQNSNANIRRVEQRIRELERAAAAESREEEGQGYTYREDTEENRIMFLFPGKPDDDTRQLLKGHGFRWSPTRKAWVRMLNNPGRYAAMRVRERLDA